MRKKDGRRSSRSEAKNVGYKKGDLALRSVENFFRPVATPPNVHTPYTSTRATYSHPYVDNGVSDFTKNMCGKDTGALEGVTTNSAPITSWYADVISAGVAAPIPAQEFGQLSMLDNLNSDFLSQQ